MGRRPKEQTLFLLGPNTKTLIEEVSKALLERGVTKFNAGDLIESIVSNRKAETVNKYVSEATPLEYKLKVFLKDEAAKEKLNQLTKNHDFGLPSASQ